MLRRNVPAKSPFQSRLEAAFPWMVLAIILIGVFFYAIQTIQYRTEERLAEKQACRDHTADISVDCTVYFGPDWKTVEPMDENTLLAAP